MATEKSLYSFADTIKASVDHASQEINNNGQLWKNFSGDLDHVKFPAPTDALLPEGVDLNQEPLTITARNWHGRGSDKLAFWLETPSQPGWEMPSILGEYDIHDRHPTIRIKNQESDEDTFSRYVTSYMSLMKDLPAYIASNGMAKAFREGIRYHAESGIADASLMKRTGHKIAPTSHYSTGFRLKAHVVDRTNNTGDTTTTIGTEIDYFFRPSEELLYGGRLLKTLGITLQDGEIIETEKKSSISLMDIPFVDRGRVNAYSDGSAAEIDSLPEQLREHLYSDDTITDEDISYFVDLTTKPLTQEDVQIF